MSNNAAGTAVGPMVIAAVEQHLPDGQRLLRDELAARVLSPAVRPVVRLARWKPFRDWLVRATERQAPGIWGSIACRKRYIDDVFTEALRDGVESVVVLGSGLDTRACRIPPPDGVPVFEVDLPVNVEEKRRRLDLPETVTLVPVDFETEDLETVLVGYGYLPEARSMFVWEGVTQYLTAAGVDSTFGLLAKARKGSRLVFTHVCQDFLDGTRSYGAQALRRRFIERERLWRFGLRPAEVEVFLAERGWRLVEQVGAEELAARYVRWTGRSVALSDLERCVLAEKV